MNAEFQKSGVVQKAADFAMNFFNLVKALEMYTDSHSLSLQASEKAFESLQEFLEWRKEVQIAYEGSFIYVNGLQVRSEEIAKYPSLQRLVSILKPRKIFSVTIERAITQKELVEFAKILPVSTTTSAEKRSVQAILHDKAIFTIRINEADFTSPVDNRESLLLNHFLDGSLGDSFPEQVRETLFLEIKEYSTAAGNQVLDHVVREASFGYPIVPRDLLASLGEKWVHFTGEIIRQLLGNDAFERRNPLVGDILSIFFTTILQLPVEHRGTAINALIDEFPKRNIGDKIDLFYKFWKKLDDFLNEKRDFLKEVTDAVNNVINNDLKSALDVKRNVKTFQSILSELLEYPSLSEKVFSAIYQTPNKKFIHELIFNTLETLSKKAEPNDEIIIAFHRRLVTYCSEENSICFSLTVNILKNVVLALSDRFSEDLYHVTLEIIEHSCSLCKHIVDCKIIDVIPEFIQEYEIVDNRFQWLVDIWRLSAMELLKKDVVVFKKRVPPLVATTLNPANHIVKSRKEILTKGLYSFAETQHFRELFQRLITKNRDERFKAIREFSQFGDFAVWVCLGGINSQNWYLRRNLATVIGSVVELKHTYILKELLRDHDWHVRMEIIKSISNRALEIEEAIKSDPSHPVVRILCLALLDGNKMIREEAMKPIRTYRLIQAFKSLRDLYSRLAAINADSDIDERVAIIQILSEFAREPHAPVEEIIGFIAAIAAQKEGIITPNWMIPIKKAAVQALASIRHPEADKWLEILAREKPHKRGIVGREARLVLQKRKAKSE